MSIVTLAQVKEHLRIRTADTTQDVILGIQILAADEWISNYLNQDQVPKRSSIQAAALLFIADLYENREGAGEKDIKENPAVKSLLYPYRVDIGM